MIHGRVSSAREAELQLSVFDASGAEQKIEAILDTGYDGWLTLPPDIVASLALPWKRRGRATPADGSTVQTDIYEATP